MMRCRDKGFSPPIQEIIVWILIVVFSGSFSGDIIIDIV